MTDIYLDYPRPFLKKTTKPVIPVSLHTNKTWKKWLKSQDKSIKALAATCGFTATPGQFLCLYDNSGAPAQILFGINEPLSLYDTAALVNALLKEFDRAFIGKTVFTLTTIPEMETARQKACLGWALACYRFNRYKKQKSAIPALLWPEDTDQAQITATLKALCMIRTMINTPARDLGPEELGHISQRIAEEYNAEIRITKGKDLQKNFPLIHAVGQASPRVPRLVELSWGKDTDPGVTLVGKGVCYDTGGLNIKSSSAMALMKKDMAGAAHALALARFIMERKLPVRLRVLIPAVDNDISGGAFCPGDILPSRKGLTVEVTNTDAEGRLILADALARACEEKPDILIDFATLTGAKMVALGHDIGAIFSNNSKILNNEIKVISEENEDPLWPFPLWQSYTKLIQSPVADLVNSAGVPGDLLYSALFLQQFVDPAIKWIHLDIYAWENSGRPGRSKGGTDQGLRTMMAYIEKRFGS